MTTNELDEILALQLVIGRLGEKELNHWWNVDLVYRLGGSDFLTRLTSPTLAPLAAAEGLLMAAKAKEEPLLNPIPGSNWSLFVPEPPVQIGLMQRLRHFKSYPDDVPKEIYQLVDPETDWNRNQLLELRDSLCHGVSIPPKESTAYGQLYLVNAPKPTSTTPVVHHTYPFKILALAYPGDQRGAYQLPYIKGTESA